MRIFYHKRYHIEEYKNLMLFSKKVLDAMF